MVWAHNSHTGDASKTEMGLVRDELNIGQLCRERFGEAAALIAFGTHGGDGGLRRRLGRAHAGEGESVASRQLRAPIP